MVRKIYTLNDFLKEKFNEKIYKVSLDGGFTCPNRDGKLSKGGCIFCSEPKIVGIQCVKNMGFLLKSGIMKEVVLK